MIKALKKEKQLKPTSFRFKPRTLRLIEGLKDELGVKHGIDVLDKAVEDLHKRVTGDECGCRWARPVMRPEKLCKSCMGYGVVAVGHGADKKEVVSPWIELMISGAEPLLLTMQPRLCPDCKGHGTAKS